MRTRGQSNSLSFNQGRTFFEDLKPLLESNWPVVTKFHIWPSGVERTNILQTHPGHIINMAVMPIYMVKSFKKKSSPPEPMNRWP